MSANLTRLTAYITFSYQLKSKPLVIKDFYFINALTFFCSAIIELTKVV